MPQIGAKDEYETILYGVLLKMAPMPRRQIDHPGPSRPAPHAPPAPTRAQRTSRTRESRESAIARGLDALERWLCDVTAEGAGRLAADIDARAAPMIRRLVDAKAGGLADEMAEAARRIAGDPAQAEAEIARLWLIAQAYRRQHQLPPPLRAELRRLVGWRTPHVKTLQDPNSLRLHGHWRATARRSRRRWDRLTLVETWLLRDADAAPALLLDFTPPGAPPPPAEPAYQGGLAYLPAATPLRALPASLTPWPDHHAPPPPAPQALSAALSDWRLAMAATPWRRDAPIAAHGLLPGQITSRAPALVDAATCAALPLTHPPSAWAALTADGPLSAFGLWDGARFDLLAVWNPGGFWRSS